jgi:hypothetical protein
VSGKCLATHHHAGSKLHRATQVSQYYRSTRLRMIDAKTSGNSRLRIVGYFTVGICAAGFILYLIIEVHVVRLDRMYPPKYEHLKKQYFSRDFPRASNIEAYLFNSTLLLSNPSKTPPKNSRVYYFGSDYGYTVWRVNLIETGAWRLFPLWQLILLGNQWRFATVQMLCAVICFAGRCTAGQLPYRRIRRLSFWSRGTAA